jgi:hypothetical protein
MNIAGLGQSQPYGQGTAASAGAAPTAKTSVRDEFMKWAKMTPAERMRANILASMGLSEDDLARMSVQEREKIEEKIRELIKLKLKQDPNSKGQLVDQKV